MLRHLIVVKKVLRDQEVLRLVNDKMAVSIMQQIKILWKDFSQVRFLMILIRF